MTTQSDHDARTPEERLLSKKRLGSFYLEDVRALIAERDNARERALTAEAQVARLTERIVTLESDAALVTAEAEVARLRDGLRQADDLLRRLAEWDMLTLDAEGKAVSTADAPYWRAEIAKSRALMAEDGAA